jgi:succinoglycan biosynthesis transport protein ExoP
LPETGNDIRSVSELLWSRKWLVLGAALLGGLLAAALAWRQPLTYQSEAKVLVQPAVLSPTDPTQTIDANMDTEAELADSTPVAGLVIKRLNIDDDPGDLLNDLEVKVAPDTEILAFTYRAPDAVIARERAQAFAEGYLAYRRQRITDEALQRRSALNAQGRALETRLQRVTAGIKATSDPEQIRVLQLQADNLVTLIVANQLSVLSFPQDPAVGEIVQPASSPDPSGLGDPFITALGVLLGAALGTVLVLVRERLTDRPRSAYELETKLTAPTLALVPNRRRRIKDRNRSAVELWNDPNSPMAEAFRVLRTNLLASPMMKLSQTLLVTSAQAGEGKTTVAAHLGIALALAGHNVVLVDAALRRPTLHRLFRCSDSPGLTDVAKGLDLQETVRGSDLDNFRLLTSGASVDAPVELLGSDAMHTLLQTLEGSADIVLIDGGSVLGVADGLTLAPLADGILVVVDAGVSDGRTVQQARRLLDLLNVPIVGGVLNRYSPSEARRAQAEAVYGKPTESETVRSVAR